MVAPLGTMYCITTVDHDDFITINTFRVRYPTGQQRLTFQFESTDASKCKYNGIISLSSHKYV